MMPAQAVHGKSDLCSPASAVSSTKREGCPLVGAESKRPKIDLESEHRMLAHQFHMGIIAIARIDNNEPGSWKCRGRVLPIWKPDDIMHVMSVDVLKIQLSTMVPYIQRKGG